MSTFKEKTFNIPELAGISKKTIDEHLKLYAGYVKHANLILEKIDELRADYDKNAYLITEVQRRLGFEYGGMRNHEHYFAQFEGGAKPLNPEGALYRQITEQFNSFENWLDLFKKLAMGRGIGWVMLHLDTDSGMLVHNWVDEQHLGQLAGLKPVLALDMWEHSYMLDYVPSEKKKYVDAFFENLNWNVVEDFYGQA